MKKTEKIASNIIQKIVIREKLAWPPVCGGIIYQPERPVDKNAIVETSEVKAQTSRYIRKK